MNPRINKDGNLQCRFSFSLQYNSDTFMLDDEKPKYRHRNKLKVEEGNKEEFSHDLAVYRIHSDNPRVTCHNRHVSICNAYLLKVEYVNLFLLMLGLCRFTLVLIKFWKRLNFSWREGELGTGWSFRRGGGILVLF